MSVTQQSVPADFPLLSKPSHGHNETANRNAHYASDPGPAIPHVASTEDLLQWVGLNWAGYNQSTRAQAGNVRRPGTCGAKAQRLDARVLPGVARGAVL